MFQAEEVGGSPSALVEIGASEGRKHVPVR